MYQLRNNVRLLSTLSLDTDLGWKLAVGTEFGFSAETKFTVQYVHGVQALTELQETMILM